jgi:hypothetical protein
VESLARSMHSAINRNSSTLRTPSLFESKILKQTKRKKLHPNFSVTSTVQQVPVSSTDLKDKITVLLFVTNTAAKNKTINFPTI